jgi:hypothetical protein
MTFHLRLYDEMTGLQTYLIWMLDNDGIEDVIEAGLGFLAM